MSYDDFFRTATQLAEPFPYQREIALRERLPGLLRAPTGAGKTAGMILGWLWHRQQRPETTARRLVYCLPMRVLVDQVERSVTGWLTHLFPEKATRPLVQVLYGGRLDEAWAAHPEREAVLIGTQDQLLSRALNRGYAMSRFQWPMHFGLLHNDAWWVLDEVQLMGAGVGTSAQLEGLRRALGTYGATGCTWMSATLRPDWLHAPDLSPAGVAQLGCVELSTADLEMGTLQKRREAPKPVRQAPDRDPKALASWIADEVHVPGTLTLIVVNRVQRAQDLTRRLQKALSDVDLVPIHARFRAAERQAAERRLRDPIPLAGRIVVATQTVEAGVDLDAKRLVTDLAPWPSLVQRFGRCNRRGDHDADETGVWWIDLDPSKEAAPYETADLERSRAVMKRLTNARIADLPQVEEALPYHDLPRRKDVIELFDTDPDLDGNYVDVSRFVRATDSSDVTVYWRDLGPDGPAPADPAPRREELCPVSVGAFRTFLERELPKRKGAGAWQWDRLERRFFRVHRNPIGAAPGFVAPGQTYLLHARSGGYDELLGFDGKSGSAVREIREDSVDAPPIRDDALDSDPDARRLDGYVELTTHLRDTGAAARAVLSALMSLGLPRDVSDAVARAALWHDVGKAHAVFQGAIVEPHPSGLLAKAPHFQRYARRGFRHELASALSALAGGLDDLAVYLVLAHHGKVRLSLRPLAWASASDDVACVRGVEEHDRIPSVDLEPGERSPEVSVSLEVARLGVSQSGPSWSERAWRLVERPDLGPFRLAYLETLVRAADWRASAEPSATLRSEATEKSDG